MQELYEYIQQFTVVSQQEFQQIAGLLDTRRYEKKVTLTQIGDVEKYVYIIQKGIVRKYFLKGKNEIITQLAKEKDLVCSSVSFLSQQPSQYAVETIEPCIFYALSFENMQKIYDMGPNMERLGRLITLDWLLQKEIWEHDRLRQEPRERFKRFVSENNDTIRRVPQKYLASYLNMKPETFSRYKHLIK
jgi:CRP-like cAMP-binding protein